VLVSGFVTNSLLWTLLPHMRKSFERLAFVTLISHWQSYLSSNIYLLSGTGFQFAPMNCQEDAIRTNIAQVDTEDYELMLVIACLLCVRLARKAVSAHASKLTIAGRYQQN